MVLGAGLMLAGLVFAAELLYSRVWGCPGSPPPPATWDRLQLGLGAGLLLPSALVLALATTVFIINYENCPVTFAEYDWTICLDDNMTHYNLLKNSTQNITEEYDNTTQNIIE